MKRSELYGKVFEKLAARLVANQVLSEDDAADELALIDYEHTEASERNWFATIDCGVFQHLIDEMKLLDADSDIEVEDYTFVKLVEAENDHKRELKPFYVNDINSTFVMITGLCLREYANNLSAQNNLIVALCIVLAKIIDNDDKMNEFWSLLENDGSSRYYVAYNSAIPTNKLWDAYSYAYLFHINNESFPMPEKLSFDRDTHFSTNLSFDQQNRYEQYYEIYHVLAESKYCDDILSRYVNIYRVIEDLCYRRLIAKISTDNAKKSGFIRHTIRIVNKASQNELSEITKGINELFPQLDTIITINDLIPFNTELENHYSIKSGEQHSITKISKIIYAIRNSIVHNKHTELHFSFGNIDDYKDLVDLIKLLIEKLEDQVIILINDHNQTIVEFDSRQVMVY